MKDLLTLTDGDLADLPEVMIVMETAFDPRFGEAWTFSQCAGLLPMPGVWLTLARTGDALAGFALSRIVADEAELLLLAVKPDARGGGVGRALLERFADASAARGARRLHLEVRDGNGALNLYSNAGFTLAGRRSRYYSGADGELYDALTLSRPVTSHLIK
jgi:ribosomal-protein-alanine N-acetyltransferase